MEEIKNQLNNAIELEKVEETEDINITLYDEDDLKSICDVLYFIANTDMMIIHIYAGCAWDGVYGIGNYAKSDYDSIKRQYKWSKQFKEEEDENILKYKACIYHLYKIITSAKEANIEDEISKIIKKFSKLLDNTVDDFNNICSFILETKGMLSIDEITNIFAEVLYWKMKEEKLITRKELKELLD